MKIAFPPASFFGIPLGLLGLGLAWRSAIRLWPLPAAVPEAVLALAVAFWAVLTVLYAAKWIFARSEAEAEVEHPIACCFVGLGPATTSLVGLAVLPYARLPAVLFFGAGAISTLGFALFRTGRLWQGGRSSAMTTAVLYLPTVTGGFVTATAAGVLGWREWGQLAFGAGLFSWLAIESVLLHRLYTAEALPIPIRPTLGIQLAPPAVGALAYLNVSAGNSDIFAQALIGYALMQALLLIRMGRWLTEQPFTPSYWAFSFGPAALSGAVIRMASGGSPVEQAMAPTIFVLSNVLIATLVIRTALLPFRRSPLK